MILGLSQVQSNNKTEKAFSVIGCAMNNCLAMPIEVIGK